MLVRVVKDWQWPDIFQQTPQNKGVWEGISFTEEKVEECDLLVVLNTPSVRINTLCPIGARWLFSQESPIDLYRYHLKAAPYFDKYFCFWDPAEAPNIVNTQTALSWHIKKTYDELVRLSLEDALEAKRTAVSWVTSDATQKEGHRLRMNFKNFLYQQQFSFDLFGRGFCPIDDKFDGVFPYKYSIAIENYSCDDYWTEKITDCFLSWTLPIYYGAKNITRYFPKESMLLIDPNRPEYSLQRIKEAMAADYYETHLDHIKEASELILNKYQFFPWVKSLIEKDFVDFSEKKRICIPANRPPQASFLQKIKRRIFL